MTFDEELDTCLGPDEFLARPYQTEILKVAIEHNTIIFLPTGSGKTFIAVMVINSLSKDIIEPNKKMTVMLVNNVPLVEQHAKTIRRVTDFTVGEFTGDMNVDFWTKEEWMTKLIPCQISVFTAQVFLDILRHGYFSLEKVNLLIFDECHQAVCDQPMRQVMQLFSGVEKSQMPRVLGLTATLLNGNCSLVKVMEEVKSLETTFHSKVATVQELEQVIGYSTNPVEKIVYFDPLIENELIIKCKRKVNELIAFLKSVKCTDSPAKNIRSPGKKELAIKKSRIEKDMKKILNYLDVHVTMVGLYGYSKALLTNIIQLERMKRQTNDTFTSTIIVLLITSFTLMLKKVQDYMSGLSIPAQIFQFSSPKVICLLEILRQYKDTGVCGLIFVKQRFTCKILHFILKDLSEYDPDFHFIRCEFMFGVNAGVVDRDTRENFYVSKVNKKIVNNFKEKEINILIASNVVEEGIDVPTCSLVVKFDNPLEYRSYIQSKGRARHKTSKYIIMVPREDKIKYQKTYTNFIVIEKLLQNYLIGKTDDREIPSDSLIKHELYDDHDVPPYFAKFGHVTAVSSISLLNRYCQAFHRDQYASFSPNWYIQIVNDTTGVVRYVVEIEMPISSPLKHCIMGPAMLTKHSAKRAAALEVIKKLHEIGELSDRLLPKLVEETEIDFDYFFPHWPKKKDTVDSGSNTACDGTKKSIREHQIVIPSFISHQPAEKNVYYFHPIIMGMKEEDLCAKEMNMQMINSELQYGLLTTKPLERIANFPIFLSVGEITIHISSDRRVELFEDDIQHVTKFNHFLYKHLLNNLEDFVACDKNYEKGFMLVVPIRKTDNNDFSLALDIVTGFDSLEPVEKPVYDNLLNLKVNDETHLKKIVIPWYRPNNDIYLVLSVCPDVCANSPWPNTDYESYIDYYRDKYNLLLYSPQLPMLLVKRISTKLNCILPRSVTLHGKRKREAKLEGMLEEHLVPELCILQKYPAQLWYQAYCLPTILHRVVALMRAEDLKRLIHSETGFGSAVSDPIKPLLLDHTSMIKEPKKVDSVIERNVVDYSNLALPSTTVDTSKANKLSNKDYATRMLEKEYSWNDDEEPVDIDRQIDRVTVLDIEFYDHFVTQKVNCDHPTISISSPNKSKYPAITLDFSFEPKIIKMFTKDALRQEMFKVDQTIIFQCVTSNKAQEIVNLERLETLGDSFLKFITSYYLFVHYPKQTEGILTHIKGKIIGNRNLLYCGLQKNLGGYLNCLPFEPISDWLPPGFVVPKFIETQFEKSNITPNHLFSISIPENECITGCFSTDTIKAALDSIEGAVPGDAITSANKFFGKQNVPDKTVSDCVEALIGAYLQGYGLKGALAIIKWFEILPVTQNDMKSKTIFQQKPANPLIHPTTNQCQIDRHILNYQKLEQELGYTFKNRAYLLQALTHASFSINRFTDCYQRLEFLGDAVIDFLITCHIFEVSDHLSPGQLTDLRSALVNNTTFACLVVRNKFHKHLKYINTKLMDAIDIFAKYQEMKGHIIDDEALILVEEHPMYMAEHVEVPKVLGDLFEALIGAVFLDTNMDLNKTWDVVQKLMWYEIEAFVRDVPKNPVRMLFETPNAAPKFGTSQLIDNGVTMLSCTVMVNGKKREVFGFGESKVQAKKAAAKLAMRLLANR